MAKRDWTAGPWLVFDNPRHKTFFEIRSQPDNEWICDFEYEDDHGSIAQANARLIAAAPELYEALTDLVAGYTSDKAKRAAAALKKAEG